MRKVFFLSDIDKVIQQASATLTFFIGFPSPNSSQLLHSPTCNFKMFSFLSDNLYLQLSPSYIKVMQCGGSCHNSAHSCVSTRRETKAVSVMLSTCTTQTGRCPKQCALVEVEEDTACSCSCLAEQTQCDHLHTFNTQTCSCDCSDREQYQLCRSGSNTWYFFSETFLLA